MPRAGSPQHEPETTSTEPCIGLATLLELFDGDRTAIADLLEAALASIQHDVEVIAGSADCADPRDIIEAAHRLKGTSGSIGARGLIEVSARIETAARHAPPPIQPAVLLELRAAAGRVSDDIAAYAHPSA